MSITKKKGQIVTCNDLLQYIKSSEKTYTDIASDIGVSEGTIRRLAINADTKLPKRYRILINTVLSKD